MRTFVPPFSQNFDRSLLVRHVALTRGSSWWLAARNLWLTQSKAIFTHSTGVCCCGIGVRPEMCENEWTWSKTDACTRCHREQEFDERLIQANAASTSECEWHWWTALCCAFLCCPSLLLLASRTHTLTMACQKFLAQFPITKQQSFWHFFLFRHHNKKKTASHKYCRTSNRERKKGKKERKKKHYENWIFTVWGVRVFFHMQKVNK